MVETTLRQFLEHPKRRWIVIIVTAVIGLVLLWPAVDNYFAAQAENAQLTSEIEDAAQRVEQSAELASQLAQLEEKLARFEKEAMSKKNVESFREEVTAMVRDTQCTMLKNSTLPDAQRYQEFADSKKSDDGGKTGPKYEIMGRPLNLTVKGTQSAIVELTDRIQARKGLVQLQQYALKQSNEGNLTTLDVGLLLLDLVKPKDATN